MRIGAIEAHHFLLETLSRARHEIVVASIPDLVTTGEWRFHTQAGRLNHVLTDWLGI